MNIYFLVEGRSTEKKVYPKFIEYFFEGRLTKVNRIDNVRSNDYFLLSANGYPRIFTDVLKNAILDINSIGNYNYLVLCIDTDEGTIKDRYDELEYYLNKFQQEEGIKLDEECKIELVAQNRCIETWFLGNKRIYKENPSGNLLREYQKFYNVKLEDPELMPLLNGFDTHASFHLAYLKEMLRERNIRYTKNFPRDVAERHYLEQLILRTEENDIQSFMSFYNFCLKIKEKI